jgi:hypothetical protein
MHIGNLPISLAYFQYVAPCAVLGARCIRKAPPRTAALACDEAISLPNRGLLLVDSQ